MSTSENIYENVAEHCSSYCTAGGCNCTNSAGVRAISCTNCKHFADNEYCDLDLFDQIVQENNL